LLLLARFSGLGRPRVRSCCCTISSQTANGVNRLTMRYLCSMLSPSRLSIVNLHCSRELASICTKPLPPFPPEAVSRFLIFMVSLLDEARSVWISSLVACEAEAQRPASRVLLPAQKYPKWFESRVPSSSLASPCASLSSELSFRYLSFLVAVLINISEALAWPALKVSSSLIFNTVEPNKPHRKIIDRLDESRQGFIGNKTRTICAAKDLKDLIDEFH
jgi:hypothetical protein